jgi:hypothetical protein
MLKDIFMRRKKMASQKKVVIVENSESSDVLEFDDLTTYEMSEDEDAVDARADRYNDEVDNYSEESVSVDDLDDDEFIWEGGPTAKMIKDWKKEYGDVYVTSITFDKHIVWRVLSRLEYKQIVKKMEQLVQAGTLTSAEANMWNEEAISEICILFPKLDKSNLSGAMAGMPSLIAQEVLEASGFVALEVRQL